MSQVLADLQLHSKYSRAVSREMVIPVMAKWGKRKGIDLLATGDWMHTLWFLELQATLEEVEEGIFRSKVDPEGARFLLSTEISSIYSQGGKLRRVHTLVFAPSFAVARRINEELLKRGCNLSSDGRPIVGLSCRQLAQVVFEVDERCLVIPAHAWTPWFSVYGSKGGFDSLEECFGEFTDKIFAVETGLSSDPEMNWRIKELERRAIVSFSDAHSPRKLGREATVFSYKRQVTSDKKEFNYNDIYWAIAERYLGKNEGKLKIDYTIEFYPEEGKYHYTGHRNCNVRQSPEETLKKGTLCPVCGRQLTVGVMHRVEELAAPELKVQTRLPARQDAKRKVNNNGVVFNYHPTDETRPGYVMMVPLLEILAEVYQVQVGGKRVEEEYVRLTDMLEGEMNVLLKVSIDQLKSAGGERLAEAIDRVRQQEIVIEPGYDGEFGKVKIWSLDFARDKPTSEQMGLF
ncbi:MAG: DNA helicase UvrD [Candidatus Chisholmbacteria bacterium]|nr:DNA helicase UvrD [Candidatus Chisholmbacteria bacterium]